MCLTLKKHAHIHPVYQKSDVKSHDYEIYITLLKLINFIAVIDTGRLSLYSLLIKLISFNIHYCNKT